MGFQIVEQGIGAGGLAYIILMAPNGTLYKVYVDNDGILYTALYP